jgi:hypothetical protein
VPLPETRVAGRATLTRDQKSPIIAGQGDRLFGAHGHKRFRLTRRFAAGAVAVTSAGSRCWLRSVQRSRSGRAPTQCLIFVLTDEIRVSMVPQRGDAALICIKLRRCRDLERKVVLLPGAYVRPDARPAAFVNAPSAGADGKEQQEAAGHGEVLEEMNHLVGIGEVRMSDDTREDAPRGKNEPDAAGLVSQPVRARRRCTRP